MKTKGPGLLDREVNIEVNEKVENPAFPFFLELDRGPKLLSVPLSIGEATELERLLRKALKHYYR